MSDEIIKKDAQQLEIIEHTGKTTIVFRKAILKGKVTSSEVLNTILIAARMQAEMYIKKLSHGQLLEVSEVKALKELGEITKLEVSEVPQEKHSDNVSVDIVKSTLYAALADKLDSK